MQEIRTACEAFISGKWYLIPVSIILKHENPASKVLRRCPECKSRIKLMKEGRDGKRAHFEHEKRNSNCSQSVGYGNHERFGKNQHTYIEATSGDVSASRKYSGLLKYVIRESSYKVNPIEKDLAAC